MHGEDGLAQALKATEALRPGAETALDAATLEAIAGDAPSCALPASAVAGVPLTDVMVVAGMLKSKGEVRAGCCRALAPPLRAASELQRADAPAAPAADTLGAPARSSASSRAAACT